MVQPVTLGASSYQCGADGTDIVHPSGLERDLWPPRIHAKQAEDGIQVGRKWVERLMKAADLKGVSRRKFMTTTVRDERIRPAKDLVDRNFYVAAPNLLWVADITYVPT